MVLPNGSEPQSLGQLTPNGAETSTQLEISDYETQFIPKEGDEDNLWAVEKILAEKGNRYLLKWSGTDSNGKPWDDSWVPKEDVTDDLIAEWKLQKALERKKKGSRRSKLLILYFVYYYFISAKKRMI